MDRFKKCHSTLGVHTFQTMWKQLKQDYPKTVEYFKNSSLDSNTEKWAAAYKSETFRAGINSTQRGEGMNASLKSMLDRRGRLLQILIAIDNRMLKEEKEANSRERVGAHLS